MAINILKNIYSGLKKKQNRKRQLKKDTLYITEHQIFKFGLNSLEKAAEEHNFPNIKDYINCPPNEFLDSVKIVLTEALEKKLKYSPNNKDEVELYNLLINNLFKKFNDKEKEDMLKLDRKDRVRFVGNQIPLILTTIVYAFDIFNLYKYDRKNFEKNFNMEYLELVLPKIKLENIVLYKEKSS